MQNLLQVPGGSGGGGASSNASPGGAGGTGNTPPVNPPQGNDGGSQDLAPTNYKVELVVVVQLLQVAGT